MILCTECYIQRDGQTLMLHRNKKADDINQGKWIGVGGKFEPGESPEQCLIREVQEEAGLTVTDFQLRGMVTFVTTDGSSDPMLIFIYTASGFTGELSLTCSEGTLQWVETNQICDLDLWEGDRLFWNWMQSSDAFFSARFTYHDGVLTHHEVTHYATS
ncbi:MAG: 8-oxo-dGTP diphosphatase [Coriobacteriia bacterium]|nr:8-oxo-dGTP diphosphatase [Coriobacteriia bacterium]